MRWAQLMLLWRRFPKIIPMLWRRGTRWQSRLLICCAMLYLITPYDLLPEWFPLLGMLDDLVVVTALVAGAEYFQYKRGV